MDEIHQVAIVIDKNFCKDELLSIANKMHVWLLESENNLKNTKAFYEQNTSDSNDLLADGITTFQSAGEDLSPIDILDSIINEVDEHHNEYSHTPGWNKLYVYGVPLNNRIKEILQEFGFLNVDAIDLRGFKASK